MLLRCNNNCKFRHHSAQVIVRIKYLYGSIKKCIAIRYQRASNGKAWDSQNIFMRALRAWNLGGPPWLTPIATTFEFERRALPSRCEKKGQREKTLHRTSSFKLHIAAAGLELTQTWQTSFTVVLISHTCITSSWPPRVQKGWVLALVVWIQWDFTVYSCTVFYTSFTLTSRSFHWSSAWSTFFSSFISHFINIFCVHCAYDIFWNTVVLL